MNNGELKIFNYEDYEVRTTVSRMSAMFWEFRITEMLLLN